MREEGIYSAGLSSVVNRREADTTPRIAFTLHEVEVDVSEVDGLTGRCLGRACHLCRILKRSIPSLACAWVVPAIFVDF